MIYYFKTNGKPRPGKVFGIFLVALFGIRFLIEFIKEDQVGFEDGMFFNMGQLLSIPFIIMAVLMIWYGMKGRFPVGKPDCPENRPQKEDKRK